LISPGSSNNDRFRAMTCPTRSTFPFHVGESDRASSRMFAFMPGLMRLCAAAGALRLGLVWLHGQPIAAQLWMVHGGRAEVYKLAYDEAFKGYSPGTVLTARLMQHVIEHDKVAEVDYLIGDDAYKTSWMSHRRERWGLVAYNQRSLTGMVLWHGAQLKRLVKPWVLRLRAAVSRSTADRSA